MDSLKLDVNKREVTGKKVRFLRRQGITPVHLLGHNIESLALQADTTQLKKVIVQAGMSRPVDLKIDGDKQARQVFVKEIQRDHINKGLIHVDFYQVHADEKMRMDVPIVLVGEAPATKVKGQFLTHNVTTLHVEGLPGDLPSQIEVDVSGLAEADQAIHLRDITFGEAVTVHAEPDMVIVKVTEAAIRAVEEAEAEAEAEATAEAAAPAEAEETAS